MSARLTPLEAINIAMRTAPDDLRATAAASLALMALELCGYKIVAADEVALADAAPASTVPKVKMPEKWPKQCARCNKIRNDRAHADECDDTACPI